MKLLFFGSPPAAVPFLEECLRDGLHEVAAVVTRPDRPAGRGLTLKAPPVKEAALARGLHVLQPVKVSIEAERLRAFEPDLVIVVAYGSFLKSDVLSIPRLGCLNVHFSLLPKYRGAAPVQWALLNGETRTGVTLFWIDEGMDSGPVQRQAEIEIAPDEDARGLFDRLIALGVRELRTTLRELSSGTVRRKLQTGESTRAPKIDSQVAALHFGLGADQLHNRVRGLRAGPKAFLSLKVPGKSKTVRLSVLKTGRDAGGGSSDPGLICRVEREKGILVQCSVGRVWIEAVQPEGKRPQKAADFLNGMRMGPGDRFETAA